MKVEVDVSELEWGELYKDEKCKEVEGILQGNPQYAECEVKRARYEDNQGEDPFYVLDEKEEEILMLERWEVYALSGSEFLSYIGVQRWRSQTSFRMFFAYGPLLLPGLFAIGCALVAPFFLYMGEYESFSFSIDWAARSTAIFLFTGPLAYLLYRHTESRKRNMDLRTVEKDPSFLDALRRLAEAAEADKYRRKEFVKRVKDLEDAVAGINS